MVKATNISNGHMTNIYQKFLPHFLICCSVTIHCCHSRGVEFVGVGEVVGGLLMSSTDPPSRFLENLDCGGCCSEGKSSRVFTSFAGSLKYLIVS